MIKCNIMEATLDAKYLYSASYEGPDNPFVGVY